MNNLHTHPVLPLAIPEIVDEIVNRGAVIENHKLYIQHDFMTRIPRRISTVTLLALIAIGMIENAGIYWQVHHDWRKAVRSGR